MPCKAVTAKGLVVNVQEFDKKTNTIIAKPDIKPFKRTLKTLFKKRPDDRIWYRPDGNEVNNNQALRIVAAQNGEVFQCVYDFALDHIEKGGRAWTYSQPAETFKIKHIFQKDVKRFSYDQITYYNAEKYHLLPEEKRKDMINKIPMELIEEIWEVDIKEWESLR